MYNPYAPMMAGADMQRSQDYYALMSGLDLAPLPPTVAAQPALASGFDLVSGLDLSSGLDLVSGAADVEGIAAGIVSGAISPNVLAMMPPVARAAIQRSVMTARANQQAAYNRQVQQPRIIDNGPRAYKEQTQNLTRTSVGAGAPYVWQFTILGRAAKITDLIIPDSIASFFDITNALLGNDNLFHGSGNANGETFAASARRTGFESDTLPTGSIVSITFQNVDAVAHSISARIKMKVAY